MDDKEILAEITRIYHKKLSREPDQEGLSHWFNEIKLGRVQLSSLSSIFESSTEFKMEKFNDQLLQKISQYYREYLKRDPDEEGLQHFLIEIRTSKMKLEDLKTVFENSNEFKMLETMKNSNQIPTETKDGLMMYLNPTDRSISYSIFVDKEWEPFETFILKSILQKNSVYIDIGANIGYYTLLAGSIVKNGKVFSFEPVKQNLEILERNIIKNNLTNIQTYPYAVSDKNGFVDIFLSSANTGNVRLFKDDLEGYAGQPKSERVKCICLDDFLDADIRPDIIKMDIQGGEIYALKGMKNLIRKTEQLALFTEFWPKAIVMNKESPHEFLRMLHDLNFEIYDMDIFAKKLIKKSHTQLLKEYSTEKYMAQTNLLCLKNMPLSHKVNA